MTLRELLQRYAARHALSERTVTLFTNSIDRFSAHLEREPTLDDLTDEGIARFARWRATDLHWRNRPPRPATVKKDVSHLSALWQHAAKKRMTRGDGTLLEHPDLPRGLVRVSLRPPRGYRLEEVDAMILAARGRIGQVGPVPAAWHWETLLTTAWQTGERIGGLLALRWRDVDLAARRVTFDGSVRKGGTKTIVRSITPELAALLAQHRRGDADLVWPWREYRRPTSLWRSLTVLCHDAKVTPRGFHAIRKASGSYVAAAGGDATEYLSHSDPSTTRQHYLDASIVGGDDPLTLLPRLPSERAVEVPAGPAPEPPAAPPPPQGSGVPHDAGRRVGASLAARGLACPPRAQHEALCAAAGVDADGLPAFSAALLAAWAEGQ